MNMEPVRFGVIGCGLMGREFASVSMRWLHLASVSYTHLTLPTILLV